LLIGKSRNVFSIYDVLNVDVLHCAHCITISTGTLVFDGGVIITKIDIVDGLHVRKTSLFASECGQLNLDIMPNAFELKALHLIEVGGSELLLSEVNESRVGLHFVGSLRIAVVLFNPFHVELDDHSAITLDVIRLRVSWDG